MDGQNPKNHSSQSENQTQLTQNETDASQASPGPHVSASAPLSSSAYTPPRPPPRALKRKSPHEESDAPVPPLSGTSDQTPTRPERVYISPRSRGVSSTSPTVITTPTRTLAHRPIARVHGTPGSPASLSGPASNLASSASNLASPASPKTPKTASRLLPSSSPVNEDMVQATRSYTPLQLDTMAYVSPDAKEKAGDAKVSARLEEITGRRPEHPYSLVKHWGKKDEREGTKGEDRRADSMDTPETGGRGA
ncbi:hypothetical protein HDK64DRAFT_252111 [Phyllosticta capitalensis]